MPVASVESSSFPSVQTDRQRGNAQSRKLLYSMMPTGSRILVTRAPVLFHMDTKERIVCKIPVY